MGKRKYLSEIEDVEYMTDAFIDSMNMLLDKRMGCTTGEAKQVAEQQKLIFGEFVNSLYSFTDGTLELSDEKISNCITKIDKDVFETSKMYTIFSDIINKIVAYYRSYKNPEITRYYRSIKYNELNYSFYKWISMINFIKFKNKLQNIRFFVSNFFTR